jgi:hypothetical protein
MKPWLLLVAAVGCHDVTSPQEYVDLVEASRACSVDAECVLAGAGDCTCPAPVNASEAATVDEAAAEVDCRDVTIECPAHSGLHCAAGRCVSPESP